MTALLFYEVFLVYHRKGWSVFKSYVSSYFGNRFFGKSNYEENASHMLEIVSQKLTSWAQILLWTLDLVWSLPQDQLLFGKVFLGISDWWLDSVGPRLPVCRTNFSMSFHELEGLDESKDFVNGSPNRKIIDSNLSQDSLAINDKQSSQSNSVIASVDSIVSRDLGILVGQDRNLHFSKPSLFSGQVSPSQVREVWVCRAGNNLRVDCLEFIRSIREGNDLSRADKREVQRIEEQDDIFAFVVWEFDVLELSVDDSSSWEVWSRFSNLWAVTKLSSSTMRKYWTMSWSRLGILHGTRHFG